MKKRRAGNFARMSGRGGNKKRVDVYSRTGQKSAKMPKRKGDGFDLALG